MTTEAQREQAERGEVLRNDKRVREQASTLHSHAQVQADETNQGRFRATGTPHVVGASAIPKYPQASGPFQRDPVPDEPPTGYCIDEMAPPESSTPEETQAIEPTSDDAPSPVIPSGDVQCAGVGSPSTKQSDTRGNGPSMADTEAE